MGQPHVPGPTGLPSPPPPPPPPPGPEPSPRATAHDTLCNYYDYPVSLWNRSSLTRQIFLDRVLDLGQREDGSGGLLVFICIYFFFKGSSQVFRKRTYRRAKLSIVVLVIHRCTAFRRYANETYTKINAKNTIRAWPTPSPSVARPLRIPRRNVMKRFILLDSFALF